MTGKKISESIKNDIIHLYKHTGETTSTLAERYGVSNSTISRMLKNTLPEQEYEVLIASKRAARVPGTEGAKQLASSLNPIELVKEETPPIELKISPPLEEPSINLTPIIKRRNLSHEEKLPIETISTPADDRAPLSAKSDRPTLTTQNTEINFKAPSSPEPLETKNLNFPIDEETNAIVAEMLGEDMLAEAEDSEGLEDLDDLDDDEDEITKIVKRRSSSNVLIQVLPLSEANLPKTCYLVIDRLSELITRPLKDFGDLGQIPAQETNQKTLPIFDNHRVARRFSTKRDRVIKVPDSKMLQKACPHLQAKGITRLLVDGQVYSLIPS